MDETDNKFISIKIDGVASHQNCELFFRYGAAIYGILLRTLGHEKLAGEILIKTFLRAKTIGPEKDSRSGSCFRKLLAIAMSMAADCVTVPGTRTIVQEKSLEGLLGQTLLSHDDKYAMGREIRKKLSAFRKI